MPARTKAKVSQRRQSAAATCTKRRVGKRERKKKKGLSRRRPRADQNRHHSVGGSPRGRIGSLFIISACVRRPRGGLPLSQGWTVPFARSRRDERCAGEGEAKDLRGSLLHPTPREKVSNASTTFEFFFGALPKQDRCACETFPLSLRFCQNDDSAGEASSACPACNYGNTTIVGDRLRIQAKVLPLLSIGAERTIERRRSPAQRTLC